MLKMASFLEVNEAHRQQYGHLLENTKHKSNDPALNELEKNKLGILIDNAVKFFCQSNKLPQMSLDGIREAVNTSANAVTFIRTELPMVMKVYANAITKDMVSVQPMVQPDMKIHYYDLKREDGTSLADDVHNQRDYANNVEYDEDDPTAMKEIELEITGSSISATSKKLKARWTLEAEQDIYAYHGISVENNLSNALGTEITREWDRTIIQDLLDGATGGASTFSTVIPDGISYTDKKVWMEGLLEACIDTEVQIFKKRYRKPNWMITTPEIAAFIEKMGGFVANPLGIDQQIIQTGGRYFTGTLNQKWKIFVDPFFSANKILMGYNNNGDWMDTCYVFAPYILAYMTGVFMDPNTQKNVRSILSRAARKCVVGDLLGVVSVQSS